MFVNCLCGGIGRRTRLKIWRGQTRVGSSPTISTMSARCEPSWFVIIKGTLIQYDEVGYFLFYY